MAFVLDLRTGDSAEEQLKYLKEQLELYLTGIEDNLTGIEDNLIGIEKDVGQRSRLTFDDIYPVGSIYMSVNSTDPGILFGGTWAPIQGRFLVAQGSNGASGDAALNLTAGTTGGKKTVTLSAENMPYHRHSIPQLSMSTYGGFKPSLQVCNVATGSKSTSDNPITYAGESRTTSSKNSAYTGASNTGGSHSHTTNANNTGYAGGSGGAATAHENLPPYLAVYMWKRTA